MLREGYDQMLKKIERGEEDWNHNLGENLHEFLNYKANVIMREKLQNEKDGQFTKVEHKKSKTLKKNNYTGDSSKYKIIFCNDYNIGNCSHRDHHDGRFAGEKCTRFHICKKCYMSAGEVKSHRESDDVCPRKGN